jgi:tetratricopeptide (TPR) repeat protein
MFSYSRVDFTMRLTVSQSWLLVLTAALFVPSSIRSAYSAEIEPPRIQTNCKAVSSSAIPVLPLRFPPTAYSVKPEHVAQVRKIQLLIQAKRWDQARQEFQNGSTWVQDETIRPLLTAMVQANETARASRFVLEQFLPQSQNRAEGIGAIASELIKRNQVSDAIALLKNLPKTSNYLSDAIIPIVGALTATNQINRILEVMVLFPVENEKWSVWTDVAREVSFEPAQARQVAGMIKDAYLRSMVRSNMAERWVKNRNLLNAWIIANDIENCGYRAETFLSILPEPKNSDLKLSNPQTAQALDQLEALIAAIPNPENTFPNPINLRLSLSKLNIQNGRKPQATRLLQRIAKDLKPSDSNTFRAVTLIEIASQYQAMGNGEGAVQMLDSAVTAIRAAYQPQTPKPGHLPWIAPSDRWGEGQLTKIAKMYRSLNQIQKAETIERSLPQPPKVTIPDRLSLPRMPPSVPIQRPNQLPSLKVPANR